MLANLLGNTLAQLDIRVRAHDICRRLAAISWTISGYAGNAKRSKTTREKEMAAPPSRGLFRLIMVKWQISSDSTRSDEKGAAGSTSVRRPVSKVAAQFQIVLSLSDVCALRNAGQGGPWLPQGLSPGGQGPATWLRQHANGAILVKRSTYEFS